jgi:hypothetical protein
MMNWMNMKKNICGIVFLAVFLWACIPNSTALDDRYPPFDLEVWKDRTLKATPINRPYEKGKFQEGDVAISWVTKVFDSSMIKIRYKNKLIERIELPEDGRWSNYLGDIYYVDLDHNGLPDIVISPAWFFSGLGSFNTTKLIYFQIAPGKFRRLEFTSFNFEIADFVNFDRDGRPELLMMQLAGLKCSDGKFHSFWVYVPYEVKDFNLVMDKSLHPDFPKFIWYSEKQNNQPTDKLSQKQKNQYLNTLPALIKSMPV